MIAFTCISLSSLENTVGWASSLDKDAHYGSPDSIRTDVALHDESDKIIAIYDVKTGKAGLTSARVSELLAKTRAAPDTAIIELRFGRAIEKYVLAQRYWY